MKLEAPRITLLRHTEDPERVVAASARLCYSNSGIPELQERLTADQMGRLINMCLSQGHHSVLEHASFTFGIEGISRAMTHQLVRHRVASYSQQSQRYVKYGEVGYIVPPSVAGDPALLEKFTAALKAAEEHYRELCAAGVAAEDARYLLPNATSTKIVVTMNARELRHFFAVRCCNRAQWEIRGVAIAMLRECMAVAPLLFVGCGPACLKGPCPEGTMTCGHITEVRAFFRALSPADHGEEKA